MTRALLEFLAFVPLGVVALILTLALIQWSARCDTDDWD